MIEHVHCGCKQYPLIGLAGTPGQDFGEEGFSDAGIADDHDTGAVANEVEIHEAKDAVFHLQTAFVMIELETVDGGACAEMGKAKPPFNRATIPGFEFTIDEGFQGSRQTEILSGSLTEELIQVPAHRRECQLIELLLERVHRTPFENAE